MKILMILFLCSSQVVFAQKDRSFPFGKIEGQWKQIQDTAIILTITKNHWTFKTTDNAGKATKVRYKVKYEFTPANEVTFKKDVVIVRLRSKNATIALTIDGIKGLDALYVTDNDSKEKFGYIRLL